MERKPSTSPTVKNSIPFGSAAAKVSRFIENVPAATSNSMGNSGTFDVSIPNDRSYEATTSRNDVTLHVPVVAWVATGAASAAARNRASVVRMRAPRLRLFPARQLEDTLLAREAPVLHE